jgi:hypothetical protein
MISWGSIFELIYGVPIIEFGKPVGFAEHIGFESEAGSIIFLRPLGLGLAGDIAGASIDAQELLF